MLSADVIIRTLSQQEPVLKDYFYIDRIGIFGSYAKGIQTEDSDIDFVVGFQEACPDLFEVKYQLRKYLGELFAKQVDIANIKYIKPYIMKLIEPEIRYVDK